MFLGFRKSQFLGLGGRGVGKEQFLLNGKSN